MKLIRHQRLFHSDFNNIYTFPNGVEVECQKSRDIKIRANVEFSGLVEQMLGNWGYKKDRKSDETVEYRLSDKSESGEMMRRKDLEDLLWNLYSLGS